MDFDQDMDQAAMPGPSGWDLIVDSSPCPVVDQYFNSATELELEYTGAAPQVSASLEQIGVDPLLHGVNGAIVRPPQFEVWYP
ncbi:hypothetical protein KAR91_76165 [Candidatus Pacearchaeota archaeon]|nr:hypothetical protein [Candidatus Pacearchaeota archaeon]